MEKLRKKLEEISRDINELLNYDNYSLDVALTQGTVDNFSEILKEALKIADENSWDSSGCGDSYCWDSSSC